MSRPVLLEQMTVLMTQRREEMLKAAHAEADRIMAQARHEMDALRLKTQAAAHVDAERMRVQRLAQAERQAEKELLTLRDRVVEDVLNQARQQAIDVADTSEFEPILKALLSEVVRDAPNEAIVEVPPAYEQKCREQLDALGHRGLRVIAVEHMRDGVALRDQDQTFRVLNTLASRFDRVVSQARRLCMHRLFEETRHARS
jgi:vacuolar-type H+-ATPase subunit E/Vma4